MQKVVITTAKPISAAVLKAVKEKLAKQYGKDLEYKLVTDAQIIGGVKILVGTQEIDATVAHKLALLRTEFSEQG